jgi:hypothetical protein
MGKGLALFALLGAVLVVVLTSGCTQLQGVIDNGPGVDGQAGELMFFAPLTPPEGTVGVPYPEYSFCEPISAGSGATCGALAGETTNPIGGTPPYSFSIEFGSGFLPTGMALELNGLLRGTPLLAGTYQFGVCANDGTTEDCQPVVITVNPAKEPVPKEPIDNEPDVVVDNGTVPPVTPPAPVAAAVTINGGSCAISGNNGYMDIKGTMCQLGSKYAAFYEVKTSGSMTGPEGSYLYVGAHPQMATTSGDVLSCGEWELDKLMNHCTRQEGSSAETAQWSYTARGYGEQVNVDPNMQETITAGVHDTDWRTENIEEKYVVSCPTVDYCH